MTFKPKLALRSALAMAALAIASAASAAEYRWTFTDFDSPEDDSIISGTFDYNTADGSYSNWDIFVRAEPGAPEEQRAFRFTSANSTLGTYGDLHIVSNQLTNPDHGIKPVDELQLNFATPLSNGGTVFGTSLASHSHYYSGGTLVNLDTGFHIAAAPIPEPEMLTLSLSGLAAIGVVLRRRRSKAAAA